MNITFYEKPGCINNTRQRSILDKKGHKIEAKSVFNESWTRETLRPYFGNLPLEKWFNMTAPGIKNGEIDPANFTPNTAIDAMIENPYLIRRPLMSFDGHRICGFDHPKVKALIDEAEISSFLTCPQENNKCS